MEKLNTPCNKNKYEYQNKNSRKLKLLLISIFLLGSGVILILGNMGEIPRYIIRYIFSWQSLLIALGILNLTGNIRSNWFGSFILISIGSIFLIDDIVTKPGNTGNIWPLVLIVIGIALIIKLVIPKNRKKKDKYSGISEEYSNDDFLNISKVFSGSDIYIKSQRFQGGKVSFVFGGGEIDLRGTKLAEGTSILKIDCVFGGVKLLIPNTWDVSIEASGVFGGFSDERRHLPIDEIDKTRKLIIKADAVFGGGEISN